MRAIRHLSYVQIDTISVVVRAHNHVLRNRVPNFEPAHINRLLEDREIFEYRFPVAAFRPIEHFRFTRLHTNVFRSKPKSAADRKAMAHVLDRITAEGPLRSRDFEHPVRKTRGWWDWKPAKRGLELLYYQGDLMISARDGFEKSYDLTERVLPATVDTREPTMEELASHLVDTTLLAHGFATHKTFASGGRRVPLRGSVKAELARRTDAGELCRLTAEDGSELWAQPETIEGQTPRAANAVRILSPFDNAVTERERLMAVFDFDYQIECFVPQAKRRFGYFCLPVMHGDRLVARMDCKSHRNERRFEVKGLFLEPEFAVRERFAEMVDPLATAIIDYARFDDCDEASVTRTEPAFANQMLTQALTRAADFV